MKNVEPLRIFVAALVLLGFAGTFGWAFWATWSKGPSIARLQAKAINAERDRADASRRLDDARAAAAKAAAGDKEARDRDVKIRGDDLERLTKEAAAASTAAADERAIFSDNITYLATALAGLVGTVVATLFGQELGENRLRAPEVPSAAQSIRAATDLVSDNIGWRNKMSTAYAIVYLGFGFAAIAIWAFAPFSPEMIKNLATISLTLLLAIARAFFS